MIRIGVLDSGIGGTAGAAVVARADFPAGARAPDEVRDALGHGSAIAAIIAAAVPGCALLDARIFHAQLRCSPAQAAAGIDWLVAEGAQLINLSLGLRSADAVLQAACERALGAGVVLVASAPARGEPVYPAAWTGVIRATGDARCARGEISWLATAQADFGGHVRSPDERVAGASIGCAHVSAAGAALLARDPANAAELPRLLAESARYRGPERRLTPP